jgi:uncharacterized membrane protein YccC
MRMVLSAFGPAELAYAARILGGCILAYGTSRLLGISEGYWSLITVVIVTQPDLSGTVSASRNRIIGTLIGAAVGALALLGREHGLPTLPLYAAGLVPLVLLTAVRPTLRLSCITLTIVVLASGSGATIILPMQRVAEIIIGTLAALLVSLVHLSAHRATGDSA